ncbi:SRR1-domain-containing protein [Desarmillaria ectypa]|nr:SRR1-domain-containing protein [Desarmillaria ectypa]
MISRSIQALSTEGDSIQRVIGAYVFLRTAAINIQIFLAETFEPGRFVFGHVSPTALMPQPCHGHARSTTMSSQTISPGSSSEFIAVSSQRKRKNRPRRDRPSVFDLVERTKQDLQNDPWTVAAIRTESFFPLTFVSNDHYLPEIVQESSSAVHNNECPDVLCLGLGSPCSSPNSRAQLAFLLLICKTLNIDYSRVSLYDPVFTEEDICFFEEQKLKVLPKSHEREGYAIESPTLVYMPHCDMELHEDILKDNSIVRNAVLICNRLGDYVESNPSHKLEARVPYLCRMVPFLISVSLPPSNVWPAAFNNTSVQYLPICNFDAWFSENTPCSGEQDAALSAPDGDTSAEARAGKA